MTRRRFLSVAALLLVAGALGWWAHTGRGPTAEPRTLLRVLQDGKWGLIDSDGRQVLPCVYPEITLYTTQGIDLGEIREMPMNVGFDYEWSPAADPTSWATHSDRWFFLDTADPVQWIVVPMQRRAWRLSRAWPFLRRSEPGGLEIRDSRGRLVARADAIEDLGRWYQRSVPGDLLYSRAGHLYLLTPQDTRQIDLSGAAVQHAYLRGGLIAAKVGSESDYRVYGRDGVLRYQADWLQTQMLVYPIYPLATTAGTVRFMDTRSGTLLAEEAGDEAFHLVDDAFVLLRPGPTQLLIWPLDDRRLDLPVDRAAIDTPRNFYKGNLDSHVSRPFDSWSLPGIYSRADRAALLRMGETLLLLESGRPEPVVVPTGDLRDPAALPSPLATAPATATRGPYALWCLPRSEGGIRLLWSDGSARDLPGRGEDFSRLGQHVLELATPAGDTQVLDHLLQPLSPKAAAAARAAMHSEDGYIRGERLQTQVSGNWSLAHVDGDRFIWLLTMDERAGWYDLQQQCWLWEPSK